MVTLSTAQLRAVLQLPERPFEDVYPFDGSSYYDLSHREPCTVLTVSGTTASSSVIYTPGVDYQLNAGMIDWSIGVRKPDINSVFVIDYTFSRLGGISASTAVANAVLITQMDLGSTFAYGSTTAQGVAYNDLATFGAVLVAAREACYTLANSDIDYAQKARRGSVLFDDSKKTEDWASRAKEWDERYIRYKAMIRGPRSFFDTISRSTDALLFCGVPTDVFDHFGFDAVSAGLDYSWGSDF